MTTKITLASICIGSAGFTLFGLRLLQKYPWTSIVSNLSTVKPSIFVEHWPISAMDEERQSRKNLRRYPKKEQERRLGIQRRRMNYVNSTLSDIFLESNAQLGPNVDPIHPFIGGLPWPFIKVPRTLSDANMSARMSYIVLPEASGAYLAESILLNPGEEIRFSFPFSKSPRAFDFEIYPLTPTNLRAQIGQYASWGKNFNDDEINKVQRLYVPVSDPSASTIRLQSINGAFFIIQPKVVLREGNGRLPIQISTSSPIWAPNPSLFTSAQNNKETIEESAPDPAVSENMEDPPVAETPPQTESTPENQANSTGSPSLDNDLLEQRANQQIVSESHRTIALGYNLLLFQLDDIPWEFFSNTKLFEVTAPNIFKFLQQSLSIKGRLEVPTDRKEIFRKTVLGSNVGDANIINGLLLKHYLNTDNSYNLYTLLRKYSYHVASFAPPSALGIPDQLSMLESQPSWTGRWLSENDQVLYDRRNKIDSQNEPLEGLDAVFPTKDSEKKPPIGLEDYKELAKFLSRSAEASQQFPDWRANDIFLINNNTEYYAKITESFQNWIKENSSLRFFAHVLLDDIGNQSRASLKDFWKVVKIQRFRAFTNATQAEKLSKLVLLDKAFGQMIDALSAKRLEHRTVVGVIIPHSSHLSVNEYGATFLLKLPGLNPQKNSLDKISIDDTVATLLTHVGIPLGKNLPDSTVPFSGQFLEQPLVSKTFSEQQEKIKRFFMFIDPDEEGCSPFEWHAVSPIFGLRTSNPVVEVSKNASWFRVFPCSLNEGPIRISWYQGTKNETSKDQSEGSQENTFSDLVGGYFYQGTLKNGSRDLPFFLFGDQLFRMSEPLFARQQFLPEEVAKIFDFTSELNDPSNKLLAEKIAAFKKTADNGKFSRKTGVFFGRSDP